MTFLIPQHPIPHITFILIRFSLITSSHPPHATAHLLTKSYPPSIHQFLYPPIATITLSGWSKHCCCIIQRSPLTRNFSNAISPNLLITFALISSRWSDPSVCCTQSVLKHDEHPCYGCLFSGRGDCSQTFILFLYGFRVHYSAQHWACGEMVATDCYFVITTLLMI